MEHHAPHNGPAFEGYYSKFDLPSGAHLVIVICRVKDAPSKPNALSLVLQDTKNRFHREIFADTIDMRRTGEHAFILDVPGVGYAKWHEDSTTEYDFKHEDFSFKAKTTSRVPWSKYTNTPESLLVNLPLPLHWHVQSLASRCTFSLSISGIDLPKEDTAGEAIVHQEKNWAHSFPSAHHWVQARKGNKYFCCAGGKILGLEAFLLGYRSEDLNIDFRPPFAVRLPGIGSPFMTYSSNWDDRTFELSVQSFRQKIVVKASARKGSFFALASPFPDGHRPNFLNQSLNTTLDVKIYESGWLSPWKLVREDRFEGASLEFGGGYYPLAGSDEWFN